MEERSAPVGRTPLRHVVALDGVRGIAILLVVLFHAYGRPSGGALGVRVFFVLSGFLITSLLLREHDRDGRISLRGFYRRRALRLLPALAVVLAVYAALTLAVATGVARPWITPNAIQSINGIAAGVLFVTNLVEAWNGLLPPAIGHLWSLATEEQFYLLWPLTLGLLLRRRISPRALTRILSVAVIALVVLRPLLVLAGASERYRYFAPEMSFDALLVGCLFGAWLAQGTAPRFVGSARARRLLWPLAAAAAAFPIFFLRGTWNQYLAQLALVGLELGWGYLLATATLDARGLLARGLRARPLVWLGRISYGLYLWHPVILWSTGYLSPTEGLAVAVAASVLCYRLVERPFLRLKDAKRAVVAPSAVPLPTSA